MRLIFAGTPTAAVPALEALAGSGHEVVRVVTRPPAPVGRRRALTPSPVQLAAERLGLPLLTAARLDAGAAAVLLADAPDLAVVVAYGALVREPLLTAPRLGWINLHFSLLPRWRGAAPVQRALIAGDEVTGATVFRLEAGLDTGHVLAEDRVPVGPLETAGDLLDRLAILGAGTLVEAVDALADGTADPRPQVGEPVPAPKLVLEDGRLDWREPAARVLDRYRGCTPEPGAWTVVGDRRVKVLEALPAPAPAEAGPLGPGRLLRGRRVLAGCGDGVLELVRVQPEGRGGMSAADWARGLPADARLG